MWLHSCQGGQVWGQYIGADDLEVYTLPVEKQRYVNWLMVTRFDSQSIMHAYYSAQLQLHFETQGPSTEQVYCKNNYQKKAQEKCFHFNFLFSCVCVDDSDQMCYSLKIQGSC